jgi:hypothetical protein
MITTTDGPNTINMKTLNQYPLIEREGTARRLTILVRGDWTQYVVNNTPLATCTDTVAGALQFSTDDVQFRFSNPADRTRIERQITHTTIEITKHPITGHERYLVPNWPTTKPLTVAFNNGDPSHNAPCTQNPPQVRIWQNDPTINTQYPWDAAN